MKIIKIGGSALTDKRNGKEHVEEIAERVARELINNEQYIIIHGVGYMGHKLAIEYKLFNGLQSNQVQWAHLRTEVSKITKKIVEVLVKHGHPAVEVSITTIAKAKKGNIIQFDTEALRYFLDIGFIPVLRGDGIPDEELGLVVISGDRIATELAIRLDGKEIIYGTDVDGVLDENGNTVPIITRDNIDSISLWETGDFSGGMKNKIEEALRLNNALIRIINLRRDGSLRLALEGKHTGTLIKA